MTITESNSTVHPRMWGWRRSRILLRRAGIKSLSLAFERAAAVFLGLAFTIEGVSEAQNPFIIYEYICQLTNLSQSSVVLIASALPYIKTSAGLCLVARVATGSTYLIVTTIALLSSAGYWWTITKTTGLAGFDLFDRASVLGSGLTVNVVRFTAGVIAFGCLTSYSRRRQAGRLPLPQEPRRDSLEPETSLSSSPRGDGLRHAGSNAVVFLLSPVDIASLVCFRICFGLLLCWQLVADWSTGTIATQHLAPTIRLAYYGFSWLPSPPQPLMYLAISVLAALALMVALGCLYRFASVAFCALFSYLFLLEGSNYLNHEYLICLLSFLLAVTPLHRSGSIDAEMLGTPASRTVPRYVLWLFRLQIALTYLYGGVAKINSDWLRAQPLSLWFSELHVGPTLRWALDRPWSPWFFSYGGLAIDLIVIPLLLFKKTRIFSILAIALFHWLNANLWNIGVFPWLMTAATILFLPPNWPRALLAARRESCEPSANARLPEGATRARRGRYGGLILATAYALVQILLPLRCHLYPGNVSWTGQGHRFAWHMMLRDKRGWVRFVVHDQNVGRRLTVDPADFLTGHQIQWLISSPDMILQFARFLREKYEAETGHYIEVTVNSSISMNGRPAQAFVVGGIDISREVWDLKPVRWIVPLKSE